MKTSLHFSSLIICIALLLITSSLNAQDKWTQLPGPFGGKILTIDNEGDNYIVGTDGGGVFLSTDIGNTWTNISEGLPFLRVDFVLIHQSKVFVAKGSENIFMSDDFGKTWEVANSGLPSFEFTSLVKLDDKIYCSIFGSGVFLSTNNGSNWIAKNKGLDSYNINSLTVNNNAIYVATQNGAYLSGNFGDDWGLIRNSNFNVKLIAVKDKDLFLATNIVVLYSSNNGLDWYTASSAVGYSAIHSMKTSGPYLIVGRDAGVFVATYAWNVWTNIYTSLDQYIVNDLHIVGNILYACTNYGLLVSYDYGNNWIEIDYGIINLSVTKILVSGNKIYAGTYRNGMFISTDNGQTWEDMDLGDYRIIDIVLKNQTVFVLSSNGLYSTTNDGAIWEFRDVGLENRNLYNIVVKDDDLIIGTDKGLYRSTNDGWAWYKVSSNMESHQIRSIFINQNQDIYVATEENIYYSTDDGVVWKITNYGMENLSTTYITGDKNKLVVGTMPEKYFPAVIYISYDNGETWESSDVSWENQYVSSISISDVNIFANIKSTTNAEDLGILFSSNNGKSWQTLNDGLPTLNVNYVTNTNNKIYTATNGAGIYSMDTPPMFLAVNLLSPIDKTNDLIINPLLDWEDSNYFDFYTLQISTKFDKFDKHLILDTSLSNSEFQLADSTLQYEQTYYWRVRKTKGNRESDWSEIFSFTTEKSFNTKPKLMTPANNSENIPVLTHFTWEDITDASDYYMQVSTSMSFSDNIIDVIVPDPYYDVPKGKLDFNTLYYWRVKAKVHNYNRDWSEFSSFTTEELNLNTPQLISPENNSDSLSLNIKLIWSEVPNADEYMIQLSSDNSFADLLIDYTISDTSYNIPHNVLDYGSSYFWRVKAILDSNESEFSDVWTFSTMIEVGVRDNLDLIKSLTLAPNPVSDIARINLIINTAEKVNISLYNSLGIRVKEIFDGRFNRNQNNLDFSTKFLTNGIYFIKVQFGEEYQILKLIVKH